MTEPAKKPIVAAIVHDGDRTLLIERRISEATLLWAFVSGEIEDNEDPSDAAIREANEELGIKVLANHVIGTRVHPNTQRTMIYVACELDPASPEATVVDTDEIVNLRWCNLNEVDELTGGTVYQPVRDYLAMKSQQ